MNMLNALKVKKTLPYTRYYVMWIVFVDSCWEICAHCGTNEEIMTAHVNLSSYN